MKFDLSGQPFLNILNAFGLHLSSKTGGALYNGIREVRFLSDVQKYQVIMRCGETIQFIDASLFLKGIRETEASTKFTLFEKP